MDTNRNRLREGLNLVGRSPEAIAMLVKPGAYDDTERGRVLKLLGKLGDIPAENKTEAEDIIEEIAKIME